MSAWCFSCTFRGKQPWFIPGGLIFAAAVRANLVYEPAGVLFLPQQYGSTFTQAIWPALSAVGVVGGGFGSVGQLWGGMVL